MQEDNFIAMIVEERIDMVLNNKEKEEKVQNEEDLQAEKIIDSLSEKDRRLVNSYYDKIIHKMYMSQKNIYEQGFKDGMELSKFIHK